jgi:hypothetical protein
MLAASRNRDRMYGISLPPQNLRLSFWGQHPPPQGEWSSPAEAIHPGERPRHALHQVGRKGCGYLL